MCNEWKKAVKYFLNCDTDDESYYLQDIYGDTARFYHVAMLRELEKSSESGKLYTYHFGILSDLPPFSGPRLSRIRSSSVCHYSAA